MLDAFQLTQCKNNDILTVCEAGEGYDPGDTRQEILHRGYLPIIGHQKPKRKSGNKGNLRFFLKYRRMLMKRECIPKIWASFDKLSLIFF